MKNQFEKITRFIPELEAGDFGTWAVDKENDGTPEHPIQLPFVDYSQVVYQLHTAIFEFCNEHPEYDPAGYQSTLEANDIGWSTESMEKADVSSLNAKALIALLVGAWRAERFCDGALLEFFENGAILRWLKRLREIDEKRG